MVRSRLRASWAGVPNVLLAMSISSPSPSPSWGGVLCCLAKGAHLDDLVAPEKDLHQAEAAADNAAVLEQAAHLAGVGVGAHVEILGPPAQEQVAHAPSHQVGLEAVVVQPVEYLQGLGIDVLAADVVLVPGYDAGLWRVVIQA